MPAREGAAPDAEWQGKILGCDLLVDDNSGHVASDPFVQFTASTVSGQTVQSVGL